MKFSTSISNFSTSHHKLVTNLMVAMTLFIAALAVLPSLWPHAFPVLNPLKVDTDPENMLPRNEPVRVFHDKMKKTFDLHDIVVVGIVNEKDPDGVFNPHSLERIYELTNYAKTLQWKDPEHPDKMEGVLPVDVIAPSTVDNIEQGGPGEVKFEWLMPSPPKTRQAALAVRNKADRLPFLKGTMISEDGKAVALYLPITSKDVSYKIYTKLWDKIHQFTGDEKYYITGLPVANDTFGVEMFQQMAISAPLAMLIIFLLLLFFFRKLLLIISPMIIAMLSVIFTMGLLVVTGNTVHIMSSMIPVFIMPIAVLDSVHILSEFFDRYQKTRDRRKTIHSVMDELFMPMLYTSLTSAAGFASLALTPIPPVQVFGIFVAIGVMFAWVLTVTFVPAYIMFLSEDSLANFGSTHHAEEEHASSLSRFLAKVGHFTYSQVKIILTVTFVILIVSAYGISKIQINDNPVKWFTKSHPIREADTVLNRHFGGTYMAYLTLAPSKTEGADDYYPAFEKRLKAFQEGVADVPGTGPVFSRLLEMAPEFKAPQIDRAQFLADLQERIQTEMDKAPADQLDAWDEAINFLNTEKQQGEVFKDPEVLRYLSALQNSLLATGVVGKSNSLADIVKTVYRELLMGDQKNFRIPDSSPAVAQTLMTYQNSHRPQDLWHFVTPDYKRASIWVQLRSGDNKDMVKVAEAVEAYFKTNPPPIPMSHQWYGLTYINVVWQHKMVSGMLQSFLGSFLVVFLMMTVLFRSPLWGLLCMIPLTVTIALIYGLEGLVGKDYDMPIAVLSSLTLGLAVDFAIHFLARGRDMMAKFETWKRTVGHMFAEPARAITRNIIVIAVGFTPLLAAPLVPYKTVGLFMALILGVAGPATLFILPAVVRIMESRLFPKKESPTLSCKCVNCIIVAATATGVVAINLHQYGHMGMNTLSVASLVSVVVFSLLCFLISRREVCQRRTQ